MFGVNWRALERRIGLRRDATRAPIRGPEWAGAAPMPGSSQTQLRPRRKQSLLKARNGLDNGVHFTEPCSQGNQGVKHACSEVCFISNEIVISAELRRGTTAAAFHYRWARWWVGTAG